MESLNYWSLLSNKHQICTTTYKSYIMINLHMEIGNYHDWWWVFLLRIRLTVHIQDSIPTLTNSSMKSISTIVWTFASSHSSKAFCGQPHNCHHGDCCDHHCSKRHRGESLQGRVQHPPDEDGTISFDSCRF